MDAVTAALTRGARSGTAAAALFLGLAVFVTWPLASAFTENIPSDYGDPLYTAWSLAWVSRQLGALLTGDLNAWRHFWDANQLFPERSALAFSDHFIAQALPVAPVYWITRNPIATLNAAYLLAFTLNGLGTFLLVRELTGSAVAGIVGGVVLAFNQFFLFFELSHLQVISTGWMPLTIYALRRYFVTGSRAALVAGGGFLMMSNLSAGYYMVMFPPFVGLYCCWELATRRAWRNTRTVIDLGVLALAVGAVTLAFAWPYLEARARYGFSRTLGEAEAMAAAVDSYLGTAARLAIAYALAAVALIASMFRTRYPLTGFIAVTALLAFWLSLGPVPAWGGRTYPSLSLYAIVHPIWPGLDAVRVSSRFASIFLMCLAVLAGMGAARVVQARRAVGTIAALMLAVALLAMNARRPFPINNTLTSEYLHQPASYLRPSAHPPAIYRYLSTLRDPVVLAEFPFGDLWYNTRYLYFSTFHWHPLVNGFTSFYPPPYTERLRWLINPTRTPDEAWLVLQSIGTTHVVLHTDAWDESTGRAMKEVFESRGGRLHGQFDGAVVYEMPQK